MKLFRQTLTLSILSITMTFASSANTSNTTPYSTMSTIQLQQTVEKLSLSNEVPFDMGLELLRRWSES
ncbi:MAG: hypothetical protein DRQ78_06465 [Epsilonproteobacteria bacterium]|nr:MAG: hypothetical protein DRQ78_06465 [Campylobacterota bacterium]